MTTLRAFLGDDAIVCRCLFGGRSHRHDKIFVFVVVLALSIACDHFFYRPCGFRHCCLALHSHHLQSLRPTFSLRQRSSRRAHGSFNVVAQCSSPSQCIPRSPLATRLPFFDCCILCIRVGSHGGHDCSRRDRCRHRVDDTTINRHAFFCPFFLVYSCGARRSRDTSPQTGPPL